MVKGEGCGGARETGHGMNRIGSCGGGSQLPHTLWKAFSSFIRPFIYTHLEESS